LRFSPGPAEEIHRVRDEHAEEVRDAEREETPNCYRRRIVEAESWMEVRGDIHVGARSHQLFNTFQDRAVGSFALYGETIMIAQ
jgi:hypothetical protein